MESNKRKREADLPRVTYDVATRTFDRLFKEESLDDMKAVVRKKLSLSPSFPVYLSQWRDGKSVDLEDDEDFEAFSASARATFTVKVKVVLGEHRPPTPSAADTERTPSASKRHRSNKKKLNSGEISNRRSLDDSSEGHSTPETEGLHKSKRQKVSFAEENSGSEQTRTQSKSKTKHRTESFSNGSQTNKIMNTDTESEHTQPEGDVVKRKRKPRKKKEGDQETRKGYQEDTSSNISVTTPTDSTGTSDVLGSDEALTDSTENAKKSNKRHRSNSKTSPNALEFATSSNEPIKTSANPDEHERVAKKARKKTPQSESGEISHPSTSQSLHASVEFPDAGAAVPEQPQEPLKKRKSSGSIKETLHSEGISKDPIVEVSKDDDSSKKRKKAAESSNKKDSSSKPISEATSVTEKPKSTASSTLPYATTVPAPDKSIKQKEKMASKVPETEKSEGTLSRSKDITLPQATKNLPTIPGTKEKSKKGKEIAAPESEKSTSEKIGKQKKDHPAPVEQPTETQGQARGEGTTSSTTIDMKEVTRKIVADIMKKAAIKNKSSEETKATNRPEQPQQLEPHQTVQPNATTSQDKTSPTIISPQPPVPRPPETTKPVRKSLNASPIKPMEVSICPICASSPSHIRSKCPIIKAGIRSMRKKIADLEKEDSVEGAEARSNMILELQGIIEKKTKKPRVSEASKSFPDDPPVVNAVVKNGLAPSVSVEKPKSTSSTETAAPLDEPMTQPSKSAQPSSSNKAKSPSSVPSSKPTAATQSSPVQSSSEPSKLNNSKNARKSFPLPSEMTKNSITSQLNGFGDVSSFTDQDLDALVRGPRFSLKNIVPQFDHEEENDLEEDVVLEDDQAEDPKLPRSTSRSGYRSSSDEVEEEDEDEPSASDDEKEKEVKDLSFLEVNRLGSSVELDRTGDIAANAAVAADLAPLNPKEVSEEKGKDDDSNEKPNRPDSDVPTPAASSPPSASPNKNDIADPIEPSDIPPASQPEPIASDDEAAPAESTPKSEVAIRTRSQRNASAKKGDDKSSENMVSESKANEVEVEVEEPEVEEPEIEEIPKPARRTRSLMKISEIPVPPNPSVRVIRQAAPTPRTRRQIALEQNKEKEATPEPELAMKTRRGTAASKTKTPAKTPVKPASKAAKAPPAKVLSKQKTTVTNVDDSEKATNKPGDALATRPSSNKPLQAASLEKSKPVSSWAVLQESQQSQPSQTETETLRMVDELLSSPRIVPSSLPVKKGKGQKPSTDGSQPDPLFIPAESQQSFPYSQFPDVMPAQEQAHASAHDSEDEEEVAAAVTQPAKASSQTYRSLRELTRQSGRLFQARRSQVMNVAKEPQVEDLYGQKGQRSEDSDSGTDSDDDKPVSHIPAARRAGAPTRRK